MSKLIVEMDMPYRCPCGFAEDNNGWYAPCFAYYGEPEREKDFDDCIENGTRPDWCPIVGVLPDEHGDLIDRDEVKQKMIHYGFHAIDMTATEFCEDELQTIIAAERKRRWNNG